jgi:hypothetical protein
MKVRGIGIELRKLMAGKKKLVDEMRAELSTTAAAGRWRLRFIASGKNPQGKITDGNVN